MNRSVKSVVIAAGVLLVLGVVMMILMLTAPKDNGESSSSSEYSSAAEETVNITSQSTDKVLKLTVSNASGEYTFERQKRVVSSTDSDGAVSSQDEYYWTSAELKGVPQSDTAVRNFVNSLAALPAKSVVEENAEDLEKYGLASPEAGVRISFEDGSDIKLNLGIQNPASTSSAYCCTEGSNTVYLVNYYSVSGAYSAVNNFANLVLTDGRVSGSNELDYLKIQRKDLDEEIEIRYMFDVAEDAESEESIISTFNTHRFVSPVTAEIDATTGSSVCIGMYGLTMDSCAYLEQTEENMRACGLDDPFVRMTFKYGGNIRTLLLGNEILSETEGGAESSPTLTNVIGYYAVLEGTPGIYTISKSNAPWYTFEVSTIISRQPISPYIYTVESVTVALPDGEYKFDIDGESKRFFYGSEELDGGNFKSLYQQLISSIGEEMYTEQTNSAPEASVKFRYLSKYHDTYGAEEDVIDFISDGGRKYIVNINGKTAFKVRAIYVERLIENVNALLNGGTVSSDW
ncbi:MAG: DUF4340 domain-containing protein [Lachnospiraceae bacterium]|nr:DUF4340 domain-containing protein [Ruminococcus sp.]MCM1275335.1 DUF4340 domain-containing protein [Lachnospiraceae bacterium]